MPWEIQPLPGRISPADTKMSFIPDKTVRTHCLANGIYLSVLVRLSCIMKRISLTSFNILLETHGGIAKELQSAGMNQITALLFLSC
jgi:hypothetical protein